MMDGKWDMNDLFLIVFFILVFGVPALLLTLSTSKRFKVDFSSLWTHQERIDKLAVIILGTWWVHTCSMVLWTLVQKVTTADYVTYMGWAIPLMLKMWAPKDGPPEGKP